jgi:hypothetical protein
MLQKQLAPPHWPMARTALRLRDEGTNEQPSCLLNSQDTRKRLNRQNESESSLFQPIRSQKK